MSLENPTLNQTPKEEGQKQTNELAPEAQDVYDYVLSENESSQEDITKKVENLDKEETEGLMTSIRQKFGKMGKRALLVLTVIKTIGGASEAFAGSAEDSFAELRNRVSEHKKQHANITPEQEIQRMEQEIQRMQEFLNLVEQMSGSDEKEDGKEVEPEPEADDNDRSVEKSEADDNKNIKEAIESRFKGEDIEMVDGSIFKIDGKIYAVGQSDNSNKVMAKKFASLNARAEYAKFLSDAKDDGDGEFVHEELSGVAEVDAFSYDDNIYVVVSQR